MTNYILILIGFLWIIIGVLVFFYTVIGEWHISDWAQRIIKLLFATSFIGWGIITILAGGGFFGSI